MLTASPVYPELALFIDGRWTSGSGSSDVTVLDPATGEALGSVPLGSADDVVASLRSAAAAFDEWKNTSPLERAALLRRAAATIREQSRTFATLVTRELGKPIAEAEAEVTTAAEHIEWAAEESRRTYGRHIPSRDAHTVQIARREPLGPIAGFAPWNAPVITPARKIAYALAAGCTLVLKPSEETPACAVMLAQAFEQAGLPRGVLNVIFGQPQEISNILLRDNRIKGVTFTGSTEVGQKLASLSAPSMKRLTLELGGHAPVIVTADVDVESVARTAVRATFRNSGQICTSPSRFLIHRSVHGAFVDAFIEETESLVVGNGLEAQTQMGPVANEQRIAAMQRLTDDARTNGVGVPTGGYRLDGPGSFWAPTLLVETNDDSLISHDEPFGPMAATRQFDTLDEAVDVANSLTMGLASYVWTNDLHDATRLMDDLNAGSVVVNSWRASLPETPFGGFDDSGIGSEGGVEGIAAFQRTKYTSFR
ncbi:NAD-dependent succinate-semialdehyde dehydrogenase [Rhodococcus fascians]|nr:NAD-dependent succinate-semialdehyde dehydrogenase [Rhodococcus fascians]MBY3998460.1 NAD-dependent succinate-semialdehyde dehydrogenase [Rhodococcus fascians]MBY4004545.1 NAD-dependent succinate-semialdehyde dehydrogenase [Rhodococcus fascians]MBY4009273.1 NAD-dependent succinate-semialdehyde dehydrogenase [Rhodococcus fascians]MBY4019752.1 NAD-dependent succinate-semialdehyde dehydrogenase [Rhodococcus fascians]